jgi:hypothetical protein
MGRANFELARHAAGGNRATAKKEMGRCLSDVIHDINSWMEEHQAE